MSRNNGSHVDHTAVIFYNIKMESSEIIKQARARFDHEAAKKLLNEKYEAKMLFAHGGGMWRAGPDLLNLLSTCDDLDLAVILDLYGVPVEIKVSTLYALARERWQEQMNAWLLEYQTLAQQR